MPTQANICREIGISEREIPDLAPQFLGTYGSIELLYLQEGGRKIMVVVNCETQWEVERLDITMAEMDGLCNWLMWTITDSHERVYECDVAEDVDHILELIDFHDHDEDVVVDDDDYATVTEDETK